MSEADDHVDDDRLADDPTLEEIAAACLEIQRGWTEGRVDKATAWSAGKGRARHRGRAIRSASTGGLSAEPSSGWTRVGRLPVCPATTTRWLQNICRDDSVARGCMPSRVDRRSREAI